MLAARNFWKPAEKDSFSKVKSSLAQTVASGSQKFHVPFPFCQNVKLSSGASLIRPIRRPCEGVFRFKTLTF